MRPCQLRSSGKSRPPARFDDQTGRLTQADQTSCTLAAILCSGNRQICSVCSLSDRLPRMSTDIVSEWRYEEIQRIARVDPTTVDTEWYGPAASISQGRISSRGSLHDSYASTLSVKNRITHFGNPTLSGLATLGCERHSTMSTLYSTCTFLIVYPVHRAVV